MSPVATMLVHFGSMALAFAAAWFIRHYTMPQPDPAAPAAPPAPPDPAGPALPNFGGVLGPILQAFEQQILSDLTAHIGNLVKLPAPAAQASKS